MTAQPKSTKKPAKKAAKPRVAKAAPKSEAAAPAVELVTFKGFDKDWRCRGFQFEIGKSYTHTGPIATCASGFHSCENPFDVWRYYSPHDSKFAEVSVSGKLDRNSDDSKIASAEITIKAELTLPMFISRAGWKVIES